MQIYSIDKDKGINYRYEAENKPPGRLPGTGNKGPDVDYGNPGRPRRRHVELLGYKEKTEAEKNIKSYSDNKEEHPEGCHYPHKQRSCSAGYLFRHIRRFHCRGL
jgi:hypothetical protein